METVINSLLYLFLSFLWAEVQPTSGLGWAT